MALWVRIFEKIRKFEKSLNFEAGIQFYANPAGIIFVVHASYPEPALVKFEGKDFAGMT